jgi:hypothetical protein
MELMAVVGMANETNRLADGYQIEIDDSSARSRSGASSRRLSGHAALELDDTPRAEDLEGHLLSGAELGPALPHLREARLIVELDPHGGEYDAPPRGMSRPSSLATTRLCRAGSPTLTSIALCLIAVSLPRRILSPSMTPLYSGSATLTDLPPGA